MRYFTTSARQLQSPWRSWVHPKFSAADLTGFTLIGIAKLAMQTYPPDQP
jgi:hypothetical protein